MTTSNDRRTDPRINVELPVLAHTHAGLDLALTTDDVSLGGACLRGPHAERLTAGDQISIELELPGRRESMRADVEVRWTGRERVGVRFDAITRRAVATVFASLVALAGGDANANELPSFDPEAPAEIEGGGDGHSGVRPDEFAIEQAFTSSFVAIDACVEGAREDEETVDGSASMQFLLNPAGATPLGLNLELTGSRAEDEALASCLRSAAARVPFPAYDGPPIVVDMEVELDPGTQEVA